MTAIKDLPDWLQLLLALVIMLGGIFASYSVQAYKVEQLALADREQEIAIQRSLSAIVEVHDKSIEQEAVLNTILNAVNHGNMMTEKIEGKVTDLTVSIARIDERVKHVEEYQKRRRLD